MSNMRQSSMRNQRSKGFKGKNVLQMCVLAVICIWLLYQLKHSYDKKRAVEERIAKMPGRIEESHTDVLKLGRKDLPGGGETRSGVEIRNREDANEEVEEEDGQEAKHDTEFGEKNSVLDDEFLEEPERREEGDEEGNDALIDEIDSVDEEEREGGVREAREEHYRKDDASSAVHHDSPMTESELGNGGARSTEEVKMANGTVGGGKIATAEGANANLTKNVTSAENKVTKPEVPQLENESISNSTLVSTASIGPKNQMDLQTNTTTNQIETQKNSTELDTVVVTSVSLQNETIELNSVQDQNSTANVGTAGEDKHNIVPVEIKLTEKANTSETENAGQGGSGESSQMEKSSTSENNVGAQGESNDPLQMEKANASEEEDAARGELDDPTHSTVTAQEREARVDLSTLPDITIKATNTDYEAAE